MQTTARLSSASDAATLLGLAHIDTSMADEPANGEQGVTVKRAKTAALVAQVSNHQMRLELLEEEKVMLQAELEETKKLLHTYSARYTAVSERLDKQADLISGLQTLVADLQERCVSSDESNGSAEGSDSDDEVLDEKEKRRIEDSVAALKDTSYRELVRQAFQTRMGIPNLKPTSLPWWPKDGEPLLIDPATKTELMRFRWDLGWDAVENFENISTLVRMIMQQGGELVPTAVKAVRALGRVDVEDSVKKKFLALQKALRDAHKIEGRGRSVTAQIEIDGIDVLPSEEANSKLPARGQKKPSHRTSRAKGVRERKRAHLPKESMWHDPKYDAAFTDSLMSDDEDELNEKGEFTGHYISKAPTYRSQVLIDLFREIDAARDPTPSSKYIPRIKAVETIDEPPKVSKLLKNKARQWMIDPHWLAVETNQQYDVESRIVNSGRAWGDDEDPEETLEKQKRMREEKAVIVKNKKARLAENAQDKGEGSSKQKVAKKKGKGKIVKVSTGGDAGRGQNAAEDDDDDLYFDD
ncbi:hypothetical protein BKA93DRAFT_746334 [Sparassis latifolia]